VRVQRALLLCDLLGVTGQRDLSASGGGNVGGYTIQTDVLGGSLIELLRNLMITASLGARKLGGLQGDVAIPSQSGGATAFWVDENAQTASSNLTFGQIGLIPHRLSGVTVVGKRLLAQSSVDVEGLLRQDLATVLAIEIDRAALAGSGSGNTPLGILNTPGVGSVTFSAAATWAKVLDFETQVANANALLRSLAYATTPNTRAKWKAATKIATSQYSSFLWEKGAAPGEGEVNSYRAVASKQVPSDKVIFGNWDDLIIADWIGMDVTIDPLTLADKHQIKATINMLADVCTRHVGSFAISSDSGAQ
jgi:HK97 family phage major capsid protein